MSLQLTGKHIAVTGAFGVLGRAVCDVLAARGARVAALDRAPAPAALGGAFVHVGGVDLSDPLAARAALDKAHAQLGGLDGLVNVAGGFAWEKVEDGAVDTWDRMYALNLRTAVVSTQAALPHLLASKAGRVVNVGATAALRAPFGKGAYAASKAGVVSLTESLSEELKERGVTVNAVLPSIIDTPANRADMGEADAHRWVPPEQLAAVIAFLLSDDAQAVTGACVPVVGKV